MGLPKSYTNGLFGWLLPIAFFLVIVLLPVEFGLVAGFLLVIVWLWVERRLNKQPPDDDQPSD